MKIEKPEELAACIAKNDELTAQLAEFEKMKEDFDALKADAEAATAALAEITKEVEALRVENEEFKIAMAASAEVGDQIAAEVAKNLELTEQLDTAKTSYDRELEIKDAEIASLTEQAGAFQELAVEYAEDAESVEKQFELIKKHLSLKGAVPDIEEPTAIKEETEAHKNWLDLGTSKNPTDRRAARAMLKANPAIASVIDKNAAPKVQIATIKPVFTDEQMEVITRWQAERAAAKSDKNSKLHAEHVVAARRIYNKNQALIDSYLQSN